MCLITTNRNKENRIITYVQADAIIDETFYVCDALFLILQTNLLILTS